MSVFFVRAQSVYVSVYMSVSEPVSVSMSV